jgi:hypothetical protein
MWDNLAIALAIVAICLRCRDHDRAAGLIALTSYTLSLIGRWRAPRRAERAERAELVGKGDDRWMRSSG